MKKTKIILSVLAVIAVTNAASFVVGTNYAIQFNIERKDEQVAINEMPMPIEETLNVNNPHIVSADAFSVLGE